MVQVHHQWLVNWQAEVQKDYERLHELAKKDPQQSGHGGESTWLRLLQDWLPPTYHVASRKYVVPEVGEDIFETDIVIFNPGYPARLREREEVLAGGVAAAFSVKLTLDAEGIKDAAARAARLRRSMKVRVGTPRSEMVGAVTFGVLAHSHAWKQPASKPRENLQENLWKYDHESANHPRESLDLVCVADLASVALIRIPYLAPHFLRDLTSQGIDVGPGLAMTAMTMSNYKTAAGPVGNFIASLIVSLAEGDPTLRPYADGLRLTETLGSGYGLQRHYPLEQVYTDELIKLLPHHAFGNNEWNGVLF
jgi:hypothetical protein